MPTYTGTNADNSWTVAQGGTFTLDGLGGIDTLYLGTSLRSAYTILHHSDGSVTVDSLTGASSALHATLYNMERLSFNSGRDTIDLTTYFGDVTPPTLVGTSPGIGATGVLPGTPLVLTFSEPVKGGLGTINLVDGGGHTVDSYTFGTSPNITVSGSTVTITPAIALTEGSSYRLDVFSGNIKDLAGNAYAGIQSYVFTTAAHVNQAPGGTLTIDGMATQGQTLSANNAVTDADGLGAFSYQWSANGQDISGATGPTFTLGAGQVGTGVALTLRYTDGHGTAEVVHSANSVLAGGIFTGGPGNDTLVGSAGDDVISGGAGADTLSGAAGNDALDGGAGLDLARYAGKFANYTITAGANGFTVTDNSGAEGSDILHNIERLAFSDTAVALDVAGAGGQAYRIYQAAFDRPADSAGLGFWIHSLDTGVALDAVAAGFVQSPEWIAMYGASPSNTEVVDKLYQHVLHRLPDAAGEAFWVHILDTGASNVADTLAAFSESPENQAALVGVIGQGIVYTPFG